MDLLIGESLISCCLIKQNKKKRKQKKEETKNKTMHLFHHVKVNRLQFRFMESLHNTTFKRNRNFCKAAEKT